MSEREKSTLDQVREGAELYRRMAEAADAGRGLDLSAGDVQALICCFNTSRYMQEDIPITENLAEWQRQADDSLRRGGPFHYDVVEGLDAEDIAALRANCGELRFAHGTMAHEVAPNLERRVAMVATVDTPTGRAVREKLWAAFEKTNQAIWRCADCEPADPMLWNRYEKGGFITWHPDTEPGDPRTFSVVTLLSPAERGGIFQINGVGDIPLDSGQTIIFPSHVMHRVSPVLAGVRDSLTLWIHSPHELMP